MTTINITKNGKPLACGRVDPQTAEPSVWTPTTGWRAVREDFFKTFISLACKGDADVVWINCPWCGTSYGCSDSHGICLACRDAVLKQAGIRN